MARYLRNTAILFKKEVTYGTDPTPTEAANAILASEVVINPLNAQNVPRDLIRGYFGGSDQLVGTAFVEVTVTVELAGAGAAGTGVAFAAMLDACGMNETLTASVRAEYNLETPVVDSGTMYYFSDGSRHKLLGCRGTVDFDMGVGKRPVAKFRFLGLDGGISATAPSALTLTAWKTPSVVTEANTGDVTFGCTYTAATPTLTGGTGYPSRGLEWSLGNNLVFTPLLGGETVDVTQREISGKVALDLTAAQEVTFMTTVKANTTQAMGLMHGTVAGFKILVFFPVVQIINPQKIDVDGRLLIGFDFRALPSTGNDEFKLVAH